MRPHVGLLAHSVHAFPPTLRVAVATLLHAMQTDSLQKLIDGYCEKRHLPHNSVRLTFDGDVITSQQTPDSLDLEDDDLLDVVS